MLEPRKRSIPEWTDGSRFVSFGDGLIVDNSEAEGEPIDLLKGIEDEAEDDGRDT